MRLPLHRKLHHVRQRRRRFQAAGSQDSAAPPKAAITPTLRTAFSAASTALRLDTMPGYKTEGQEHSFLERFDRVEAELQKELKEKQKQKADKTE